MNSEVAKYAFVYMVKPLQEDVLAFCLACLGTDNKFCTQLVLNRWKYIWEECRKRNITVISFGADGDARELKSMQVSTKLLLSQRQQKVLCKIPDEKLETHSSWKSWFAIRNPSRIAYVQDIVHLAVKLKARLLKPSIILPMSKYIAGGHDLRHVQSLFGKDQHGIRERDVNHKDRQNFEAVLHLISDSVLSLLSQMPDADGTYAYL